VLSITEAVYPKSNSERPNGASMGSILLIPGLLCNQILWHRQRASLTRRADVIIADVTEQETISAMASSVLSTAPAQFSLAGFSLGSQVALEIMRTSAVRVERLALLSATHGGLLPPVKDAILRAVETVQQGGLEDYLEAAYPTYVSPSRGGDALLKSSFMEMARALGPDVGLRQMRALLAIKGPFHNLDKIQCPTVVIGGGEDHRTTPAAHKALAEEIPGSELVILDGAAHFTPLEVPDAVTAALERWMTR
jgi:pimeloyl-ACP methyl ester carboxylesterase